MCLSLEQYIESLERQRDKWYKEKDFQYSQPGDAAQSLYLIAYMNAKYLEEEIQNLKRQQLLS